MRTIGQVGGYLVYMTVSYAALIESPWLLYGSAPAVLVMGLIVSARLAGSADPCQRGLGVAFITGWAIVVIGVLAYLAVLLLPG
ncbi:hypothetical protein [Streptosporangium roseum]|uniref:hypothetical protein n=1 Tax=Streptosporangium roseum TaxID=2001 RepID=UPI0004CCDAEC|nr:hypothetical protein [Streptosporangium roseum]